MPGLDVRSGRRTVCAAVLCVLAGAASAHGQTLSLAGDRVRVGGLVSGAYGSHDGGYFNYSDYETSRLRLFRLDLAVEARLAAPVSVVAALRSDNLSAPRVYAAYVRLQPWAERALELSAGVVPKAFGSLPQRRYATDEPLPSLPLVYQYLTTLRPDALPASAEGLLAVRGRGWLVRHPIGSQYAEAGLPLVAGERRDAGLLLGLGRDPVSLMFSVSQGSPSEPRIRDDNGGKQLSGRVQWTPAPAWTLGASAASAALLSDHLIDVLPPGTRVRNRQQAFGVDVAWSAGYWIVRGEAVLCRFELPAVSSGGTPLEGALSALGSYLEARYKIRPGLFAAGRVERLGFGEVDSALGRQAWDAPVTRAEAGLGYVPQRNVLLRASWQHDRRDAGRVRRSDLFSGSVLLWF